MKPAAAMTSKTRPEQRLLDAAKKKIARQGIHGAEIRTIARLAGTSTSRFHDFYQCRDNLLAKVFDDGWKLMESHISLRLINSRPGVENKVEAVVNGVLDALEEDPDAVGATIVLGLTTIGQPVRKMLKSTPGFLRYQGLAEGLAPQFAARVPPNEVPEVIEILFGGISRRLFMLTPMCEKRAGKRPPFQREAFLRVIRRMMAGLLHNSDEDKIARGALT